MLPVNEIFYSIQGEGYYAGTPAVFIRTQGCDVGCAFCDTKQSWSRNNSLLQIPDNHLDHLGAGSRNWTFTDKTYILAWIEKQTPANSRPLVVITGGEPLLHEETPSLIDLLLFEGYRVQVETSGTAWTMDMQRLVSNPKFWLTCSPKWEGKKPVLLEVLRAADEIKVVVSSSEMLEKLVEVFPTLDLEADKVLSIQPETGANFKKSVAVATEFCLKHPLCHLSLQTHTFLGLR